MSTDKIDLDIPNDIVFLILTKVPVKSLLRFKSVCKSWNDIISDNEFKRAHRGQSKALGREKLLLHKYSTSEFMFRDSETSRLVMMAKETFPPEKFRNALVMCSCDGLVLLKNPKAYKTYALWNPSTGEYQTLSCPYINDKGKVPNGCGICYDSSVDDYKVVLIYKSSYGIYSLKNAYWMKKTSSLGHVVGLPEIEGVSTGSCVFWSYDFLRNGNSAIIYFDGKSDELKELPTPEFARGNDFFGLITSLKGCLSLYGSNAQSRVLDIWIMEQDGWKLLMKVCNLPTNCKTFVEDKVPLYCTKHGKIFFQEWNTLRLLIYHPSQQLFTESQVFKDLSKDGIIRVVSTCLDSLYFPRLKVKRTIKRKRGSHLC